MTNDDTCMPFRDLLPAYGTGHLDAAERDLVERHLAGCARCRGEAAQWQAIGGALAETYRAIPPAPAQDQLWQQVSSRLPATATEREIQPHLNGDHAIRRGTPAMTADTEELVFGDTTPHATPPRNPFADPSQRRRSLPAIAATIFIAVLGIVLFTLIVPRHSQGTPVAKPTATASSKATASPTAKPTSAPIATFDVTVNSRAESIVAPGDVWMGGDNFIAHYIDGKWNPIYFDGNAPIIYDHTILSLAMLSDTDGWAVGAVNSTDYPGQGALLLHYVNGTWKSVNIDNLTSHGLQRIQMLSAGEGWTYTDNALFRYINGQWQKVPVGITSVERFCGISFASSTEGWLGACSSTGLTLWHYHNGQWTSGPTFPQLGLGDISVISATEGWASASPLPSGTRLSSTGSATSIILHYHNGQWAEENPDPADVNAQQYQMYQIFLHDSQEGWAILYSNFNNDQLATLHLSQGKWSFVALPASFEPSGVLSVSPDEAWAAGIILCAQNTPPSCSETAAVAHYFNGKWTIVNPA